MSSVGRPRKKIPVALLADKQRGAGPVRRRARLGSAYGDKVRHRRDCGGREKERLSDGAVIFAHLPTAGLTGAQEKTGTIRPASRPERICKVFTNHRKLRGGDQRVAQYGPVPQTGGHCRRSRAAMIRRSRARKSNPLLVNHGRKVALLASRAFSSATRRSSASFFSRAASR